MTQTLSVALVQMRSGRDIDANVAAIDRLTREAAAKGARYVQTPENSTIMDEDKARLIATTPAEDQSAALAAFRDLAHDLRIWLHIGSMAVAVDGGKVANRSLLITPAGDIAARYDKIHMFDVDLAGGESYRESRNIEAGSTAVIAEIPGGRLGLTICYDLRFPALYRVLAQAGAGMLAVPAAFTRKTGESHWHILLRARAIENGAYVLAAAQGGRHDNGRETYGHSLIIAPNGEILAEAGIDPCVITANINWANVSDFRESIPSLRHDRAFTGPAEAAGVGRNEAKR